MEIELHSNLFYVATVYKFAEICSTSNFLENSPYTLWTFRRKICLILNPFSSIIDVLRWRKVIFSMFSNTQGIKNVLF